MIQPTVGRKVWYRPSTDGQDAAIEVNGSEPLDATIVAVWGPNLVNLAILDIYGNLHARRSVTLFQEGAELPPHGRYAEWMPYQVGQAKKDAPVVAITSDRVASMSPAFAAPYGSAPRVTPADIEAIVASEHYFTAAMGVDMADPEMTDAKMPPSLHQLTFCVLVLRNGYTVTGESACVSRENFDVEIGRKVARENAVRKIWTLLGYALKQRQFEAAPAAPEVQVTEAPTLTAVPQAATKTTTEASTEVEQKPE